MLTWGGKVKKKKYYYEDDNSKTCSKNSDENLFMIVGRINEESYLFSRLLIYKKKFVNIKRDKF